jgi:hypothetical protein
MGDTGANAVLDAAAAVGRGYSYVMVVVGSVVGAALVGVGVWLAAYHPDHRRTATAAGTVAGPATNCTAGGYCDWAVRWATPDGTSRTVTGVRSAGLKDGATVDVRYDPGRPEDAGVASGLNWRTIGIALVVVGVLGVAFVWLQMWLSRRYKWFGAFTAANALL